MHFTTSQAKARLAKLVAMAQAGEEVVITSGREKKAVARLVPFEKKRGSRIGLFQDIIGPITSDLLEPMSEEELRDWEGR